MNVTDDQIDNLVAQLEAKRARTAGKPPLPPGQSSATFGGMDPWQQTVETRLGSLDTRLGRVEGALGDLRVTVGEVKTKVDALPTKEWTMKTLGGMIGVLAVLTGLIVHFVPHAS